MEFDAVDGQGALPIGHDVVTGHSDDPLDEVVAGVLGEDTDRDEEVLCGALQASGLLGRQPVVRVREDDDVTPVDLVGVVHRHGDAVALVEGVLHRARRDGEALDDEGADEGDDRHGDDQVGQGNAPLLEAGGDPLPHRGRLSGLAGPGPVLAGAVLVPVVVPAVMVGPQVPARGHVLIRLIMDPALRALVGCAAHRPSPVRRVMTTSWASWPPTL